MSWTLFLIGAAAGGFINGLAGFGTALFALGFWLHFMPPLQAVAVMVVISVVNGLQGLWVVRRAIITRPRRLLRFIVPGLIGVPLGVSALQYVNPDLLKVMIGVFLMLYGGYFSLRRNLPNFERRTPVLDSLIGFFGGVLGGLAALSGALPTMWASMRPWPKAETRALLQAFNCCILSMTAVFLFFRGAYDWATLGLIGVALPVAMVAGRLGIATFKRLDDDAFRRLIIGLTFVSGATVLLRALT